ATTSLPAVPCAAGDPNIYFAHRSALATPYPPAPKEPVDLGRASPAAWRVYGSAALVAPKGWSCSGFVAEDGGNQFTVVPPGESPPSPSTGLTQDSPATPQISIWGEPACQGCVFEIACSLFPADRNAYPNCPAIPPGEIDRRLGRYVVDFMDPPGVKGSGQPSGGP